MRWILSLSVLPRFIVSPIAVVNLLRGSKLRATASCQNLPPHGFIHGLASGIDSCGSSLSASVVRKATVVIDWLVSSLYGLLHHHVILHSKLGKGTFLWGK